MSQSLDLTKVQYTEEASRLEDARRLLADEFVGKLKDQEQKLSQVLEKLGIEFSPSSSNEKDQFDQLIDRCKVVLLNYLEDKRALDTLIEEKEDLTQQQVDL